MSLRHADIWSHPGHYLVDPHNWPWSWSWMTYPHPLCSMSISPHILRYSYFKIWPWKSLVKAMRVVKGQGHIWPWKFKVKVMAKVKPDGHIWGLNFNRYVCFSFQGNLTIFDWDLANSIIDLEKSRSRSWPKSNPMVTFEDLSSIDMCCFSFQGNLTIFYRDIANSIFDLENLRSRSQWKSTKI